MRHIYKCLSLALLLAFSSAHAQQAWRPFRPGLIYSYALRDGSDVVHTLRTDSAYQTASGDSVLAFNRLMRAYGNNGRPSFVKSRNNLFGSRLRWVPGQRSFVLESDAQSGVQNAASLLLYPFAALGRTWVAATSPAVMTAVVQARDWRPIQPGVSDSVVTIELRYGTATTGPPAVVFSLTRSHGLLEATPWLGGAVAGTPVSAPRLAALPAPLAQSRYNPAALFAMRPGDELGYYWTPFNYFGSIICAESYTLRRVLTRQQRPDSLIITCREQSRYQTFNYPTCGNQASINVSPASVRRLAFSMVTGRSPQYPALGLLANEYLRDALFPFRPGQLMGLGIATNAGAGCFGSDLLRYARVYENSAGGPVLTYSTGLDLFAWGQTFGGMPGLGDLNTDQTGLVYYRRSVGTPLACGSFINFANLLPTRAARAAAVAALFPNPAAEAATLTLAAPAQPGTRLVLRDALGRAVWQQGVGSGQTNAVVPLAGRPAGLYLLHVERPDAAGVALRLTKE